MCLHLQRAEELSSIGEKYKQEAAEAKAAHKRGMAEHMQAKEKLKLAKVERAVAQKEHRDAKGGSGCCVVQ